MDLCPTVNWRVIWSGPGRDRDLIFHLSRDRVGIGIEVENFVGIGSGSGFDQDPECLNIFRGRKLLCEILKINFENHKYS